MSKLHGGHGTLTYARWKSMMQRCNDPKASNYKHYGGRGVKVCERWHDFANFLADMGECPGTAMTLDRIKNDVGYEPGNCQWATQAEQNRHRSNNVQLTYGGFTRNVADWAATLGMSANTLNMRIRLGWSVERALTKPVKKRGTNKS